MNRKLLLQDLVQSMADKGCNRKDADTFVRSFFSQVEKNVYAGKVVKISDLGTFRLLRMDARKSVDVNTGEAIEIKEHFKFTFLPDAGIKEVVNRPLSHLESVGMAEEEPLFSVCDSDDPTASEKPFVAESESAGTTSETTVSEEHLEKKIDMEKKSENPKKKSENLKKKSENPKKNILLPILAAGVLLCVVGYVFFFMSGTRRRPSPAAETPVISVVSPASTNAAAVSSTGALPAKASALELKTSRGTFFLDGLEDDPMTWPTAATVKVKAGNRLTLIALEHYGAKIYWVYLYLANRDVLANPNAMNAGSVIRIPKAPSSIVDAGNPASLEKALSVESQLKKWFD